MRIGRWILRVVRLVAVLAVGGTCALWIEHSLVLELPKPTGPFPVGRAADAWEDLTLWMWYPAAAAVPADDYLPPAIRSEWQHARPGFINFLTRDLSAVRAHGARNVAMSPSESAYPVVLMRAGGSGSSLNFTTLAEDLASHGYIVVGLDMPATMNPELCVGRTDEEACATSVMAPLIKGIGRALDRLHTLESDDSRFKGRLDLTRVGMFGHSFGGAQVAQFCAEDSRCRAGVNIDGRPFGSVIQRGIQVPFMFLLSDHTRENDPESRRILDQIQAIYDHQPADARSRAAILGAHHFTFSDDGALLKSVLFRGILRLFGRLHIGGRRQLDVTAYALRTFFDAHLEGARRVPVVLTSQQFPELVLLP
jgi:dienelactone hydrolase